MKWSGTDQARLTVALLGVVSALFIAAGSAPAELLPVPYVVAYTGSLDSRDHAALFAMRADATDVHQLTAAEALDFGAAWSPDGRHLAFMRLDDTHTYTTVWTVGLDGSPAKDIGASPYDESPSWSPNGDWVAFQEQTDYGTGGGRADTTFDLWAVRPDGTSLHALGSGGNTGSSEEWIGYGLAWNWSPDGKHIAFMQPDPARPENADGDFGFRLVVVNAETANVVARVPLTSDYALPHQWLGWAWSPDGRRLAFVRPVGPFAKRQGAPYELAVLDVRSRRARVAAVPLAERLASAFGSRTSLLEVGMGWGWSPDGRHLAVMQPDRSHKDPRTGQARLRLSVVDARTESLWRVPGFVSTAKPYGSSLAVQQAGWSWSPEGRRIALIREAGPRSGALHVFVADVARRKTRDVGRAGIVGWSPNGKRLAVSWGKPLEGCSGIWVVDAASGARKLLVPRPAHACDDAVEWSPDGSFLAFSRIRSTGESTFTVGNDGTGLQEARTASPSEVQWPADCSAFFAVDDDWLLRDPQGVPRLVARPSHPGPSDIDESWRC